MVSQISSSLATWSCLILLLSIHLAMNRAAVRSVSLHTINRQRANIVFSEYFINRKVLSPGDVSALERIFEWDGILRWRGQAPIGKARVGVSLQALLKPLADVQTTTGALHDDNLFLSKLVGTFADDGYLLWFDCTHRVASIVMKTQASPQDHIKAWAHALWLGRRFQGHVATSATPEQVLSAVEEVRKELSKTWAGCMEQMKAAGWDIDIASIETTSGLRVHLDAFGRNHD